MVDHSVLFLAVPSLKHLRAPKYLSHAIAEATSHTRVGLLIVIYSPLFEAEERGGLAPVHHWKDVQNLLTYIYVEAAGVSRAQDNILLSVNVVFHPPSNPDVERYHPSEWEAVYALDGDELIPFDDLPITSIPTTIFPSDFEPTPYEQDAERHSGDQHTNFPSTYPVTALGGTFDHLHSGHKILLSVAAWIASEKVIVGVTDSALLVKKTNADVLESLQERIEIVRTFVTLFKPTLVYDIVPISDVYGPTGWDPNIQALVLSHETREGAAAIASYRAEKLLPPLEPFVIDVISNSSAKIETEDAAALREAKLSSTAIRQWIVNRRARAPPEEQKKEETVLDSDVVV